MAFSRRYPESLVSLPMRILGVWPSRLLMPVTARPTFMAISAVMGCLLATPRIPSVPNSLPTLLKNLRARSLSGRPPAAPRPHQQ